MSTKNMDAAMEVIGQAMFDFFPDRGEKGIPNNPEDREASEGVNKFLSLASEGYALVTWPESQDLMEEKWFEEEAILALGAEDQVGGSAYFIPIKYLI